MHAHLQATPPSQRALIEGETSLHLRCIDTERKLTIQEGVSDRRDREVSTSLLYFRVREIYPTRDAEITIMLPKAS